MKAECFPGSDITAPSLHRMSSTKLSCSHKEQCCTSSSGLPVATSSQDVGLEFIEPGAHRMVGLEGALKVTETWNHGLVGLGYTGLGYTGLG